MRRKSLSTTTVVSIVPPASGGFCDTGAWTTSDCLTAGGMAGRRPGIPSNKTSPGHPSRTIFKASPQAQRLASKSQILGSLKDQSRQIVDARSEGEFCGIDRRKNKRAGHIPTARHLEWIDLIDKKTRRFKTADQLNTLFRQAGVNLGRPTTAYCQSGGRAVVVVFAMELMGAGKVTQLPRELGRVGQQRQYANRCRTTDG